MRVLGQKNYVFMVNRKFLRTINRYVMTELLALTTRRENKFLLMVNEIINPQPLTVYFSINTAKRRKKTFNSL